MKHSILIAFLLFGIATNAQDDKKRKTLTTISYLGHSFTQPGAKLGKIYTIHQKQKFKEKRKKNVTKYKTIFISPQVGAYYRKQNHTGLIATIELGKEVNKNERAYFRGHSIGFGNNTQVNAGTTYIQEKDGSIREQKRAYRSYYMPSVSSYFGHRLSPNVSWYNKLTLGSKLNYNTGISLEMFFEIGLRFRNK